MADMREPRPRAARRPGRARILAGTAVAASVALNVWAVSYALRSEEPAPAPPPTTATPAPTATTPVTTTPAGPGPTSTPGGTPAPTPSRTPATVTEAGDGTFTVLPAPVTTGAARATAAPASGARVVRFTLEAEKGIEADPTEFAAVVTGVLTDARGWQGVDGVRFVNVTPAQAAKKATVDLRITLASPATTDDLCAPLDTGGEVSCHARGRAVLNLRRWMLGVEAYGEDLAGYRTYLVNHEVGHALGHGHESCPADGSDAPVMMQQTYGVKACRPWPWPAPRAATS